MKETQYDVVIVGSGIAGAVLAQTLTRAGKSVLLLEAGLEAGISLDPEGSYRTYTDYLNTYYQNGIKVPNAPYPNLPVAPSSDVLDIAPVTNPSVPSTKGYFVQKGPVPFGSDNFRGPGGTTLHWLGSTPRMLPADFELRKRYGKAVDWPLSYEDLERYYEMAEHEIGVAGDVSRQAIPGAHNKYRTGYVFPMEPIPQSYLDGRFQDRWEASGRKGVQSGGKNYPLTFSPTPQGRNAAPNPGYRIQSIRWNAEEARLELKVAPPGSSFVYNPVGSLWDPYTGQRCEGNASCVPICPVQAKYNALKTLRKADPDKLEIRTQSVASRVLLDADKKRVTGIEYKRYSYGNAIVYDTFVARGRRYVLACSAIENAKLLLASGAANSSDQVGRNLMDHLVMLTWGLFPEPVYPYRGPGSTTNIATFRDGDFRKEHSAWISPIDNWGWSYPGIGTDAILAQYLAEGNYGADLRAAVGGNVSSQLLLHFEVEQLPNARNRVTIDPAYRDQLGNYRPVIEYDVTDYERKAFERALAISGQIFDALGVTDCTAYNTSRPDNVSYGGRVYNFWGAGHIVGTHRMGSSAKDSVVNSDGRCWDHENLYLAGCGNMPTLGTSNPTLTMTALTFKTAEALLRTLETENHGTTDSRQQQRTEAASADA